MTLKEGSVWPQTQYDSKINNIVTEFFIPALKNSTTYRRIGGFFSSTSLALAARGIKELVENEGKMQLIVNPILTKQDAAVLNICSEHEKDEIVHRSFVNALDLENEFEKNHVAALGYLLQMGFLEIKIDLQTDKDGNALDYDTVIKNNLHSEKLGIFQDREGNVISFRGSVNESKQSWEHGVFCITVDVDWIKGQKPHVLNDIRRFEKMWFSSTMKSLPRKTREMLTNNAPAKSELNLEKFNVPEWAMLSGGSLLWNHQIRAINSWIDSDYSGIFSIATAGGKTLAALVSASLVPVESIVLILVPTKPLVTQWKKEIQQFDRNADLVVCDSAHTNWDAILPGKLGSYVTGNEIRRNRHLFVLSTIQTAISRKFMNNFEHIYPKFITVIADEVHHFGAPEYSKIFNIGAQRKLGLSATFQRDWDEIGTNKILKYFGQPIETYTIGDGIREGKLSRYNYYPFFAYLNNSEFSDYADYTEQIKIVFAQIQATEDQRKKIKLEKKYERLRMNRSEIIKKAEDKTHAYSEILRAYPKKPYVVFADDHDQIEKIKKTHKETIRELNTKNMDHFEKDDIMIFSGKSTGLERQKILDESRQYQTPIFAMYCLDEGIDVPEFQSAILVSSSTSKRQYIQRRGRILRTSTVSKTAQLYDIVVLPNPSMAGTDLEIAKSMVERETARVSELAMDADNKWDVDGIISKKLKDLGYLYRRT